MTSFFRSTSQSSAFQQAIEKVTDGSQPTEDWDAIMKICDHVSMHEESGKEAIRVIRKRLQTTPGASGWRTIGFTLTLLEALTKNCGKLFHAQIAQKDFLKEVRGVLVPKNNPPQAIQDKVLGMIQTWAIAFRDDPDLKTADQFYQECKQQGLEFPPPESDTIIKAAVSATGTMERSSAYARPVSHQGPGTIPRQNRTMSDGVAHPTGHEQTVVRQMTADQVAKLRSELDVVQTNAQIFGEMLVILQPGEEHPQDLELLMELQKTCTQMQARIVDLLTQISVDDITVDLLRYNDEFNHSFKTYDSYMEEREKRVGPLPKSSPVRTTAAISQLSPTKVPPMARNQENQPALIKFDEEPATLSTGLQNIRIHPPASDIPPRSPQQSSSASVTTRSVAPNGDVEQDVKEVEQWLGVQDHDGSTKASPRDGTTPEFNQFLEKRASTIPDEPPVSHQEIQLNVEPTSTHHDKHAANA